MNRMEKTVGSSGPVDEEPSHMAHPDDDGGVRPGRWRVVVLAFMFAFLSHGCLMLTVSLTRSPL